MRIRIKVIGPLMYAAGFSEREMDCPEGTSVDGLLSRIGIPQDRPRIVTRNGAAVAPEAALAEGDQIAVSPIYSGG
jgi:sulfur carrier protein ThiS